MEGGREGAVRWLVRGSLGLVGMFAWRECERESLLVHELPGWPSSLSPVLGSLSDEDRPLCRALQPALEHQRRALLVQGQPGPHPNVQGRGECCGQGEAARPHTSSLPQHHGSALVVLQVWGPHHSHLLLLADCGLGALGHSGAAG